MISLLQYEQLYVTFLPPVFRNLSSAAVAAEEDDAIADDIANTIVMGFAICNLNSVQGFA